MLFRFSENEFFPKRMAYARKGGHEGSSARPRNGESPRREPRPRPEPRRENPAVVEENIEASREKLGDLLDESEKADKLLGRKGESLSPKEILSNMKKIGTAAPDWLIKTYKNLYPKTVNRPIDDEIRRELARKEWDRFQALFPESTRLRIQEVTGSTPKPKYTEAVQAIMRGDFEGVDQGTKALLEKLSLDGTNTVAFHKKHRRLKEVERELMFQEPKAKEAQEALAAHENDKSMIAAAKEKWTDIIWNKPLTALGYAGKIALAGVALGSLATFGYGLIMPVAGVATVGSMTGAFTSLGGFLGTTLSTGWGLFGSLTTTLGMTKVATVTAGALGYGVLNFVPGKAAEYVGQKNYDKKTAELASEKEAKEEELNLPALRGERDEAKSEMEKTRQENKDNIALINKEKDKHVAEQKKINQQIEEAIAAGGDVQELQAKLEKVTQLILYLDSIIETLGSVEVPADLEPHVAIDIDTITSNITKMPVDQTTSRQLMEMAREREQELLANQKKLLKLEGVKKEMAEVEDIELLRTLTNFLEPRRSQRRDDLTREQLNLLNAHTPELYRLVRSLRNLPEESVLQRDLRRILHPLFSKALAALEAGAGEEPGATDDAGEPADEVEQKSDEGEVGSAEEERKDAEEEGDKREPDAEGEADEEDSTPDEIDEDAEAIGEFTAEQVKFIVETFGYGNDRSKAAVRSGLGNPNSSTTKYARVLIGFPIKNGANAVVRLARVLQGLFQSEMSKLHLEASAFGLSLSWAAWDVCKQYYFTKHPDESGPGYPVENPFSGRELQSQMINRQIGWELYRVYKDTAFLALDEDHPHREEIEHIFEQRRKANGELSAKDYAEVGRLARDTRGLSGGETPDETGPNTSPESTPGKPRSPEAEALISAAVSLRNAVARLGEKAPLPAFQKILDKDPEFRAEITRSQEILLREGNRDELRESIDDLVAIIQERKSFEHAATGRVKIVLSEQIALLEESKARLEARLAAL